MSAQQKEDRLFENIYLSYFPKMKRFAQEYVISKQDAENIVQDMFAELWEKREMFTCQTIRIAYLFTIIKNKCLNHLRHKTIALETINNMLIELYAAMAQAEIEKKEKRQREGIDAKKNRGEWDDYGRPAIMSQEEFSKQYKKVLSGELRPFELMKQLGMSKSTFYRYVKEYIN